MARENDAEILARIDPARRDKAFQMDMLAIDEEYSERWLQTMRALIARDLDAAQFTADRMVALKQWTRDRKRAQARLHWKYESTGHRRPALVERDIERTWANLEQRTERLKQQLDKRAAELETKRQEQRDRATRISNNIGEARAVSVATHDAQRAARVHEAAELRDKAFDIVRHKLAILPGAMVTEEHINLFLNMAREAMSPEDRALFLRTVRGDFE